MKTIEDVIAHACVVAHGWRQDQMNALRMGDEWRAEMCATIAKVLETFIQDCEQRKEAA